VDHFITTEFFFLVASVCALCSVIIFVRGRFGSAHLDNKIKKRYDEYIGELEYENKKLKGAVNRSKQPIRISDEAAEEPLAAVGEVLEGIAPHLPAGIRPLLKSKKAVDFITNYVQSNPEAVKQLITKFTNTKNNTAANNAETQQAL
jgi:hypothetical protein